MATDLEIVRRRRWGVWLSSALAVGAIGLFGHAVVTNPALAWPTVAQYLFHPAILRGLLTTLLLTGCILVGAILVGTIVALMRLSSSRLLRALSATYVWFFRGVPALIQLIFWFNLSLIVPTLALELPWFGQVWSVRTNDIMSPFISAVIALALCEAGYMAEIIRAGIASVPAGQSEAASSLGMTYGRRLRRIVLPQAMRFIVPPTGNEAISLLKLTSLVTYIAVDDLFYAAQSIYARTFETVPLLLVVAFWYLATVSILSLGQYHLERFYGRQERGASGSWSAYLASRALGVRRVGLAS